MFERLSHFVDRFIRNEDSGTESLVLPGQEQPVALNTALLSGSIERTEVLQRAIVERGKQVIGEIRERAVDCADANSLVGMFIDTATEVQQSNSEIAALHASRDRTPGMGNLMKVGERINAIDLQIAQIEKTRNTGLQYKAQAIIALATALSNRHEQMYEERRLAGDPTPTLPLRDFMQEARDQLEVLWGKLTPEDAVLDKKPEVGTATGQDAVGQAATTREDASTAYIQTITDQGSNVDDEKVDPSNSMQPTVPTSVEQKREEQTREEIERVGKEAAIKALSQQLGIDDTPIVVRRLHFLQDQATHATQDRERSSPLPNNFTDISDPAIRRLMQERANIVNADGILDLFLRVHSLLRESKETDHGIRIQIANVLLGRVNELKKIIDPGNEQTRDSTQVGDVAHRKLDEGEDLDFLQEQFTEYTKENADVMAIIAAVRSRFVRKTPAQGIDQIKQSRPKSEGVATTSDGDADRETGTGTEGATAARTGEAAGVSKPANAAQAEQARAVPAAEATPPGVARDNAERWRVGFMTTLRETHLPEADWMLNALEARRQRQNLSGGSNFPFDTVGEARKILEERELEREQTETEKERRIKEFWRDQGKSEEEIRALWEKRKIRGKQIPDRTEQTESHTPLRLTGTTVAREKALDIAKRWEEGIRSTLTGASILDTDELVEELQRRREEQIKAGGDRFPFDIVGEARRILEEKSKEEEKNRAVPIGELTPPDDQAEKEKRIIEFWKGSGYSQEKIEDLLEKRRKRIPDRSKQTESHTPLRLTGTTVAQERALDTSRRWEEGLRSILGSAKLPLFPELLSRLQQRRLELIGSDQDRFRIDWAQEARKILGEIEKSKGVLYLQEDASRDIDWIRGDERRLVVVTNDGKEFPAAVLGKNSDGNPILYMERAINHGRRFFSPHITPKNSVFSIEDSDYVIRGKVINILANREGQQFADSVKLEITLHHR